MQQPLNAIPKIPVLIITTALNPLIFMQHIINTNNILLIFQITHSIQILPIPHITNIIIPLLLLPLLFHHRHHLYLTLIQTLPQIRIFLVLPKRKKFFKLGCTKSWSMLKTIEMLGHLWIQLRRILHQDIILLYEGKYFFLFIDCTFYVTVLTRPCLSFTIIFGKGLIWNLMKSSEKCINIICLTKKLSKVLLNL